MILIGFLALIVTAILSEIVLFKGTKFIGNVSKKYCNGIETNMSTAEELKDKIIETNKGTVKEAVVNSSGQVEVSGNADTHIFYLENGFIKCELVKYDFRISRIGRFLQWFKIVPKMNAANEINSIFENLSETKETSSENEKVIKSVADKTKLTNILAVVSVVLIIFSVVLSTEGTQTSGSFDVYVDTIQSADLEYSNYTYEEVFNDFFENPTWEHFTSTDGEEVVEFIGKCYYGETKVKVLMQYLITYEDELSLEWILNYFEINGEPQDIATYDAMIATAIESY